MKVLYNVGNNGGGVMLLCWVDRIDVAVFYLRHYQEKYPMGKPYPNGMGYYPDFGFHLISKVVS